MTRWQYLIRVVATALVIVFGLFALDLTDWYLYALVLFVLGGVVYVLLPKKDSYQSIEPLSSIVKPHKDTKRYLPESTKSKKKE